MTNKITRETREEGYQSILPFAGNIRKRVLDVVCAHPLGLTAEQVQAGVGCSLNCARSRLTELFRGGDLCVVGKQMNFAGTRRIAVYAKSRLTPMPYA